MIDEEAVFCTACGAKQPELPAKPEPEPVKFAEENNWKKAAREEILYCSSHSELLNVMMKYPQIKTDKELEQAFYEKLAGLDSREMEGQIKRINDKKDLWTEYRYGKNSKALYENKDEITLEKESFMDSVSEKLKENKIPASLDTAKICWNEGKEWTEEYVVNINDRELSNPFSMLLQYVTIGKFTFVGENIFVEPPILPKEPGKKKAMPASNGWGMVIIGVLLLIFGSSLEILGDMSSLLMVVGILLAVYGGFIEYKKYEIRNYNQQCEEEIRQWNQAWDDWHKKNVEYVFQQDVNGKLDCIRSAVMKSVQQVCEEKFPSGPVLEDNSEVSQKDLEEAILRRRQAVL